MIGRIIQVREYTDKPNKFLVVELTDESGLHDAVKYYDGMVVLESDSWKADT